jgi:hypothetical protein
MKQLRSLGRLLVEILREIFDENAYRRYLCRTGLDHSIQAYRSFMEERDHGMARRPRCC